MNIYLITSESYKLINQEIEKIVPPSSNVIKYDLRKESIIDVINEANYFSFDTNKKFIIVKSDLLFKPSKKDEDEDIEDNNDLKEELDLLEKYLNNPSDNTIIIFTSMSGVDKRKKVYKKIVSVGKIIDIPSLNKKDMVYKCMELLKNDGYTLNYDTANMIVESSFQNYDILLNEIEKINILVKKGNVCENDLKNVVSETLNSNVYKYINSIVNQDINEAFISEKDFERLKIDPIMVLIMLAKEFQNMYLVKTHNNIKEIQTLLKQEDWKIKSYIQNANKYTIEELKNIIIKLSDYDVKMKNGQISKEHALSLITLDICS